MITLYTAPTPNGWKVSIALEELELPYRVENLELQNNEQKTPEFLAINPNGRIPAIVEDGSNLTLFESGAILLWLAEKTQRLLPLNGEKRYAAMQWLMFQMSGVGPMQGQANIFHRYFPEKIPSVIARFQKESRRLYEVLDVRLSQSEYLAGDEYSIADIANYTWPLIHRWAGLSIDGLTHLQRWMEQMAERPAVQQGLKVPVELDMAMFTDPKPEQVEQMTEIGSRLVTR